ncbi:MAG: Small-conductance mechanosensitive channel [Bacteroidetes bacterium ADurb.Bin174]|jgi:small-conductance mechanosensitive channel|nr:MAG: Small-conductance mechanosensitive channel [Bacteroidetes bacterium ADurb.Bin174]
MWTYLPQIIGTVVTIAIIAVLKVLIKRIIKKYTTSNNQRTEVRVNQVVRIFNIFFNLSAIVILIIVWGVDTRNLILVLSSVLAVIGVALFAQWSMLSNITAGVLIFFSAPYKIGDYISIIDKDMPIEAMVEGVYTFYTHLRTKDGIMHVFPNSLLLQKAVTILKEDDFQNSEF